MKLDSDLQHFLGRYMLVDEEWLEGEGTAARYFLARLPQEISLEKLPESRSKWRIRTRVVRSVTADPAVVIALCTALNQYAFGWSLAYSSTERCVYALLSAAHTGNPDRSLARLARAANHSAWFTDVIAERLADQIGGVAAFDHPAEKPETRRVFDSLYYYVMTLRSRPEWVLDETEVGYPTVSGIGAQFAWELGVDVEDLPSIVTDDDRFILDVPGPQGGQYELSGGFAGHPIAGRGWNSRVRLPSASQRLSFSQLLTAAHIWTWEMFEDVESNLAGSWLIDESGLSFEGWATTAELCNTSSRPVPDAMDLWEATAPIQSAARVGLTSGLPPDELPSGLGEVGIADAADWIIDSIVSQASPALLAIPTPIADHADRRLLWLERQQIWVLAAWFNPYGPTVCTLEVCRGEQGTYLMFFQRHPFSPDYRVLADISDVGSTAQLREVIETGIEILLEGSLPHALTVWDPPDGLQEPLEDALLEGLTTHANAEELVESAASIETFKGDPWGLVSEKPVVRVEGLVGNLAPQVQFLTVASDGDNTGSIFLALPDAWDGALNYQNSMENLSLFDVGPLAVMHNRQIGVIEPTPGGGDPS